MKTKTLEELTNLTKILVEKGAKDKEIFDLLQLSISNIVDGALAAIQDSHKEVKIAAEILQQTKDELLSGKEEIITLNQEALVAVEQIKILQSANLVLQQIKEELTVAKEEIASLKDKLK